MRDPLEEPYTKEDKHWVFEREMKRYEQHRPSHRGKMKWPLPLYETTMLCIVIGATILFAVFDDTSAAVRFFVGATVGYFIGGFVGYWIVRGLTRLQERKNSDSSK